MARGIFFIILIICFFLNLKRYSLMFLASIFAMVFIFAMVYFCVKALKNLKYDNNEISYIIPRFTIVPILIGLIVWVIFSIVELETTKSPTIMFRIFLDITFIITSFTIGLAFLFENYLKLDMSIGSIGRKVKMRQISNKEKTSVNLSMILLLVGGIAFLPLLPAVLFILYYLYQAKKTGFKAFYIPVVIIGGILVITISIATIALMAHIKSGFSLF